MAHRYRCSNQRRLALLLDSANAARNGIDYLEVEQKADGSGATLSLKLARAIQPSRLGIERARIEGGIRFPAPRIVAQSPDPSDPAPVDRLTFLTAGSTDFSTYRFRLVRSVGVEEAPEGFDPELSEVGFTFKADCSSAFDCKPSPPLETPSLAAAPIDYLSKDYESFRRLMLDRLSVTIPTWTERNPADLGVAVVEVLAHAADVLSYLQDAVATEAYLGTARRRTSIRRHARLLDYPIHDGCCARAFVALETSAPVENLPTGTPFLVRQEGLETSLPSQAAQNPNGPVYEAMHAATLRVQHNEIPLHDYFDSGCALAEGSRSATLWDRQGNLALRKHDLLWFEEICDERGVAGDADRSRRHVVRLTRVEAAMESILGPGEATPRKLLRVEWHLEDALPFDFVLTSTAAGKAVPRTVARGNLVLVDHGGSRSEQEPPLRTETGAIRLRYGPISQRGRSPGRDGWLARDLDAKPLPFDPEAAATTAMTWPFEHVLPEITLADADGDLWLPERDLLGAGPFSKSFVLETEDDGTSTLRFGDGVLGAIPNGPLQPRYRVGNGSDGMVGAGALSHICLDRAAITRVRNPWPAFGGVDPEPIRSAKLYAPYAFQRSERAVTDPDYAEIAIRHPEVQRAVAFRSWTGSWTTVTVLVDRLGGGVIDAAFRQEMFDFFERFRLTGYDVEIAAPIFVPLEIAMTVCVEPDGIGPHVHEALLQAFSTAKGAFFDPDRFSFGGDVFVSEVIARAMSLPGVAWVDLDDSGSQPNRFQRFGQPASGAFAAGRIAIGPREIARLDNDANAPENGRLTFFLRGGR
jgi:hypothetical protein